MYIEEYKASISRNNDNTLAFNNLGTVYDKQGLYDLAIEAYTNALTNNHYFPLTHNNLGIAYAMKDLYADAMDEMDLAIKYNANDYSAYRDLGLLYFKYKKDAQKSLYYLWSTEKIKKSRKIPLK